MLTERANALCILEILKEYSDGENILRMSDILSKMNTIYGICPDRRTVYSAISLLGELGYDISSYEENGVGYYLRTRDFEVSEISLLSNAVYSFPFISEKQTEELISKLQDQLSRPSRKRYRHLKCVRSDKKTENKQVFLNIELLDEAIERKKQVTLMLMKYGFDKLLHPKHSRKYTVTPVSLIYTNEHYYLVCKPSHYDKLCFYRIDRLSCISITEKEAEKVEFSHELLQKTVYAFSGKAERIRIKCDNEILQDVIDKFGTGVHITPSDKDSFEAIFDAPTDGVKYWALQYLRYAEVKEPLRLRQEITECINNSKY